MNIDRLIFEYYKDTALKSRKQFENDATKKGFSSDNFMDIYVKIHNYQVEHYGCKLVDGCHIVKTDPIKNKLNAAKRKNSKYVSKEWY